MRIAIMLRAYDRPGGIGIYARNIVRALLNIDKTNHYFLLHNNPEHVGNYSQLDNVDEIHIPGGNPVIWDQWKVPARIKGLNIDLLLNTKFSVPISGNYKKIMVLHGSSWYAHPELYGKFDIFYVKIAMPIYCRKSDFLISNSDLTTRDFKRYLGIEEDKIKTVNLAAGDEFQPVDDHAELARIRTVYDLPDRFILTVTSHDPRKNFGTLTKAIERVRESIDIDMVVVGKDCDKYIADYDLEPRLLADHFHFPGWIDQADLPGIYSLAEAFAFPSVYEEFGIPVVEAISCGCPVAASNTAAIPDLLGDAALLCDPFDSEQLALNLTRIIEDDSFRHSLVERGLKRAEGFSWLKTARETLSVIETVGQSQSQAQR